MNLVLSQQPSREEANVSGPYDKGANSTLGGVGDSTLAKVLPEDSDALEDDEEQVDLPFGRQMGEQVPPGEQPFRAIRKFCLECVGTAPEIRTCAGYQCPLWLMRFGKRPGTVRRNTPELLDADHIRQLNREQEAKIRGRK